MENKIEKKETMAKKRHVTLTIDASLHDLVKSKTDNVSQLVEDLLRAWISHEDERAKREAELLAQIQKLEAELRDLRAQYSKKAALQVLLDKMAPWVEFYKKMEAKKWSGRPELKQQFLEDTARKFGLTPGEVEAICQGARPSKFGRQDDRVL
jgi:hypothetical protein